MRSRHQALILKPRDTCIGGEPQVILCVLSYATNYRQRKAVLDAIADELISIEPAHALPCSNPQVPFCVLENAGHEAAGQPVGDIVVTQGELLRQGSRDGG